MKPNNFLDVSKKILHAYNKLCEPILKEFDLPQVSFDILMFLSNNPEYSTAQEISEIRHIKKNLVSVHVEKLVSTGLLMRGSIDGDRRKKALICTEKAAPIVEAGQKMQLAFFERLSTGISEEQWNIYKEIHDTIEANAQKIVNG